jgi:uncharacterized iron-regulated membrane protein
VKGRASALALHRYGGLALAAFVAVFGLTGAILAFKEPLDRRLNPDLYLLRPHGSRLSPFAIIDRLERADPRARVTSATLRPPPGGAAIFGVEPKRDPATGRAFALGYSEVFVDPSTGVVLGTRMPGVVRLDRRHIVPLLYRLHSTLFLPQSIAPAVLMTIAAVWVAHSVLGFYVLFPRPLRFSTRRLLVDLHRLSGLTAWPFVLIVAATGLGVTLGGTAIDLAPGERGPGGPGGPGGDVPRVSYEEVVRRATVEAASRAWQDPASSATYDPRAGRYAVRFHPPGDDDGAWGFGVPALYYDARDGRFLGAKIPHVGSLAERIEGTQYPLHTGHIAGVAGRVVVSAAGLATAFLSVTGAWVWLRRIPSRARPAGAVQPSR